MPVDRRLLPRPTLIEPIPASTLLVMHRRSEPLPAGIVRRIVARLIDESPLLLLYLFGSAFLSDGWIMLLWFAGVLHPLAWRMVEFDTPGKILTSSQVVHVDSLEPVGFGRFFWRWLLWSLVPGIISFIVFIGAFYWGYSGLEQARNEYEQFFATVGVAMDAYVAAIIVYPAWLILQVILVTLRRDSAAVHDLIAETRVVILSPEGSASTSGRDFGPLAPRRSTSAWEDPSPARSRRRSYSDYID